MLEICSLSSGSNGNVFYIRTGEHSFLIDVGITFKQVCLRLKNIGSDVSQVKGIFITHEHADHIRGLPVFLKKVPVPVYITRKTYKESHLEIPGDLIRFIGSPDRVVIGETEFHSLPKLHDAVEPSLFMVFYGGKKISFITDAGCVCANVIEAVRGAHVVFLESNYDEEMLRDGVYPWYLKARIAGKFGHLSNNNAASLVYEHGTPVLTHVFLSHLSENNNTPDIAMKTFCQVMENRRDMKQLQPLLTSRHSVSPVVRFEI